MDIEVKTLSQWTPREELIEALQFVNAEARKTHPSPRWDRQHAFIDQLLDWLVGL